jgi:hypothetical protein
MDVDDLVRRIVALDPEAAREEAADRRALLVAELLDRVGTAEARRLLGDKSKQLMTKFRSRADVVRLDTARAERAERSNAVDWKSTEMTLAVGARVAEEIASQEGGEPLVQFVAQCRSAGRLASWLEAGGVRRLLRSPEAPPLASVQEAVVLLEPGDGGSYYRHLLPIAVMEELARCGWKPVDGVDVDGLLRQDGGDGDEAEPLL